MNYKEFLKSKSHLSGQFGFDPVWIPDQMFDFQKHLLTWELRKGRSATFADCGLGKTFLQLAFAENIVRKTNTNALILTPLAVSAQTIQEGEKFGIECKRSNDGKVAGKITVTNYEKLHKFDPSDFNCVICDESSILKNFDGKRRGIITEFIKKVKYRQLFTATAAPNDFIELGTSAEALGEMGHMDMLGRFFVNDEKSNHPVFWGARWRFKKHAEKLFWKWVSSWARAIRRPSDIGFDDQDYNLPPLNEVLHVVKNNNPLTINGQTSLFAVKAKGLAEERAERRATINERCEKVAELVEGHDCSIVWGNLNDECDLMEKLIPDSVQIKGGDSDEKKEEAFLAFKNGEFRRLVTKPKIGAFGLNFQHCGHQTHFATHSYEQYYQSVRRSWRFGRIGPVTVDAVCSDGEKGVFENLKRKSKQADEMFKQLIAFMNDAITIKTELKFETQTQLPSWLQ